MQDPQTAPPEVRTLAQSVKMTPIDWTIHPNVIVIIFEQGPKITFPRTQVTPMIEKIEVQLPDGMPTPTAASTPPPTDGGTAPEPPKTKKGKRKSTG